jgi:uncharacterized protein
VRAAIDTNVLIAGLLWRGPPHALLEHVRAGTVSLVSSPALLAALAEVRQLAEVIEPPPLPQPVCRDPDDDQVLALALAAKVELIVSGDNDLLSLGTFEGIPIVAPAQAVALIGTAR